MGRATEDSVKGGLIILAFTIAGAVLLGIVGWIAMSFVGQWLWVQPVGPIDTMDPYARLNFGKMIYVATWRLGGALAGFGLGGAIGASLALRYLSQTKNH